MDSTDPVDTGWTDQVERWRSLKRAYPDARYTADFGGNKYEGRLRVSDKWTPGKSLQELIDRLLAGGTAS
jgi:hypothetical protein